MIDEPNALIQRALNVTFVTVRRGVLRRAATGSAQTGTSLHRRQVPMRLPARRFRAVLFGTLATLVVSFLPLHASPAVSMSVSESAGQPGNSAAALVEREGDDLRRYSEQYGVELDSVVQRTQYAEEFNQLADLLEERYPAQFTYASGQGPDGSPSIIGFKGDVPDGATALLEGLPFRRLGGFEGATRSFYAPIQQVQARSSLRVYTTP